MNLRVLGWSGFIFLAAGILLLLYGGEQGRSYGCGALLTAVTIYGVGLFLVIRLIARMRRAANEMMERVADELERRKGGGKKVIDVEKMDPRDPEKLN